MWSTIQITYFDPFHIYDTIRSELEGRLPLKNLHWKSQDGTLKTITALNVEFIVSDPSLQDHRLNTQPFINCVIVSCESIEEYRSKTRPLIRNWLPSNKDTNSKNVIILHSNKEILDSNLFKTVSLLEKFNKDFPNVKAVETKTVYKSNEEKAALWNGVIQRLKQYLLEVFQTRVDINLQRLKKSTTFLERICMHEELFRLYVTFHLPIEAEHELDAIKGQFCAEKDLSYPIGKLRAPIWDDIDLLNTTLEALISQGELNNFSLHKHLYLMQFALSNVDMLSVRSQKRVVNAFYDFISSLALYFKNDIDWLEFKYNAIDEFIELDTFKDLKASHWKLQICDLRREQRDTWIELGCSSRGFKLSFKTFTSTTKYKGQMLESTFSSETIFHDNFINMTKELIRSYSSCHLKRQRVMDWLSVEIALLHFDRGEYKDCLSILHSSYDFYMENNWSRIGSWLLKYYIESLVNCADIHELDIDGESVPKPIIVENAVLNILASSSEDEKYWWNEFKRITRTKGDNLIYPLDKFLVTELETTLIPLEFHKYGLKVKLQKMHIPENIEATSIKLLIKNYMDQFLCFEASNFIIGNDQIEVVLSSNDIIWDTFEYVMLEVLVEGIVFKKEFESFETENSLTFTPCVREETPRVVIRNSLEQKLCQDHLCLEYKNFDKVEKFELELTLKKEDSILFANGESAMLVKSLKKHILIKNEGKKLDFRLGYRLHLMVNNEKFTEEGTVFINCVIPIEVSADKLYFKDSLLFDITVKAKGDEFILLSSNSLTCSSKSEFEIVNQPSFEKEVIVDNNAKNSYRSFCRIIPKSATFTSDDVINLSVKYFRIREYLEQLLDNFFPFEELEWEVYCQWKGIVVPKLTYDYKAFAEREIVKIRFELNDMNTVLRTFFDRKAAKKVKAILQLLSSGAHTNKDAIKMEPLEFVCPLHIKNTIEKVYSIEFCNLDTAKKVFLGEPTRFQVTIRDQSETWQNTVSEMLNSFSISNSNEWLVGGQRRFPITSPEMKIIVNLIPLRRGYLSYPNIDILDPNSSSVAQVDYANSQNKVLVL